MIVYEETSTPGRPLEMFSIANELEELGAPFAGVTPALNCTRSNTLRVNSGTRSMVSDEIN